MIKLVIGMSVVLLSAFRRNSKTLFLILFAMMFLMAAGNVTSPDRNAYADYYISITSLNIHADLEIGFQILILFSQRIGLTYEQFIVFYNLICFSLLFLAFNRLSKNKAFALSLYMLFPYILDTDQLRSFLGQLIVLNALITLIKSKRIDLIKYLICVFLAALFQESCAVFIIYLLIIINEKKLLKYVIILCGFMMLGKYLLPLIASHVSFLNLRKVTNYFVNTSARSNWYIYAAFYLIVIVLLLLYARKEKNGIGNNLSGILHLESLKQTAGLHREEIIKINIISLALITLISMNPHFERLLRPVLLLDYITLTNLLGKRLRRSYEYAIVMVLLFVCLGRFVIYICGDGWSNYIEPLFFNGRII